MQEPERNWHKIFFYLSLSLLCTRMEEPQVQEPKGKSHKCKSHKCKSHKCKRQRLPLMFPKQSQKNASRVASGKRLVERNRLARKAKKKKRRGQSRGRITANCSKANSSKANSSKRGQHIERVWLLHSFYCWFPRLACRPVLQTPRGNGCDWEPATATVTATPGSSCITTTTTS